MKGLERFFIIGYVIGEELFRENLDKKQATFIPNPWLTKVKLRKLV